MKDWKEIGKKILFPPIWLTIILTIISTAGLITVFVKGWDTAPIAYGVYVLAFYTLTILCIVLWKVIPGYYRRAKDRVYDNEYTNRYITDKAYKTQMDLYSSLGINLLYVAFNGISAIVFQTYWFAIFAVYYAILAIMRFLLVRYVGKNEIGSSRKGELRRARLCAGILMTVNLALTGAVLMMVYHGRGFSYQGFLIYVVALYAFYITTTAIIDMVRYRKYNSPIMSVSKVIKLAAALVSMLFLETAMFSQFGQDTSLEVQNLMIMLTGAGISIVVVTMSLYFIIRATKELKKKE